MLKSMILIWTFLVLLSCKEPEIPQVELPCIWYCDTIAPTEIIWKTPVVDEPNEESSSMYPKISDSVVIFSNRLYKGQPEIYKGFNRYNGRQVWEWPFPHLGGGDSYVSTRRRNKYIIENHLILSIATYYYNVDTRNCQVNAGTRILDYAHIPRINILGNKIYFITIPWQPERGRTTLRTMDLDMSNQDSIVQYRRANEGDWDPNIGLEPPVFWERPDGDTVAIFVMRGSNGPNQSWYEFHALNLSQKTNTGYQALWMQDSFPHDDNCNVVAEPIIYRDSLLLVPGQGAVYGIGLKTGDLIYSTPIPEDLLTTDFIVVDDRLVFVDNPGDLYVLDAWTGEILTIIPDCGGNVSNMEVHDSIVYFTSAGDGKLYAVDLLREEIVWEWSSPHIDEQSFAQFTWSGLAIDPENGWLYTSDKVYAMCVELYERE